MTMAAEDTVVVRGASVAVDTIVVCPDLFIASTRDSRLSGGGSVLSVHLCRRAEFEY